MYGTVHRTSSQRVTASVEYRQKRGDEYEPRETPHRLGMPD